MSNRNVSIRDRDWVKRSFMVTVSTTNPEQGTSSRKERTWMYFTEAEFNYRNTSPGGNLSINSLPQFTRFADIPAGGITKVNDTNTADKSILGGMGRYYYESIDTWAQMVSFRFGVPEYKGILTFFTSFYDAGAAVLGRTGRMGPGLFYLAGKIIGNLLALPWTVLVYVAEATRWLAGRPSTRYYSVKPAMALYWQRVNLIANMLAVNLGITSKNVGGSGGEAKALLNELDPQEEETARALGSYSYSQVQREYNNLFMKDGGIDVYWVANRLGRMQHEFNLNMQGKMLSNNLSTTEKIKRELSNFVGTWRDPGVPGKTIDNYLNRYHGDRLGMRYFGKDGESHDILATDPLEYYMKKKMAGEGGGDGDAMSAAANNDGGAEAGGVSNASSADDNFIHTVLVEKGGSGEQEGGTLDRLKGWMDGWYKYSKDVASGGGQWVNFMVDPVKSVSESFQNNTGQSEIQSRINGMSSTAAELRFSLSDLNTGFAPLDAITGTLRNMFLGLADGLHISGLAALLGAGYVDIPERWTDSSASMPSASYTIKCRPVYGNVLSRFLNMHFVIACILAGCLPISYGRQAYGAPFICEFYSRGKNQSRLAIIESVSISRGEGNLGWDSEGNFLGCDINFTVKDLSTVMHAPIDSGMNSLVPMRFLISDDNVFNDYMAVLGNLSTAEMSYSWEKLKRNYAYWATNSQTFFSPARIAMSMGDSTIGRMVRKVTPAYAINIQ